MAETPPAAEVPVPADFNLPEAFFAGVPAPAAPARPAAPLPGEPTRPAAPPPPLGGVPLASSAQAVSPAVPARRLFVRRRARRPLPARAVLALGGLALTSLTLLATLVMTDTTARAEQAVASAVVALPPEPAASPVRVSDLAAEAAVAEAGADAAAHADAVPVPPDLLRRVDGAANLPLVAEIETFLEAATVSFGDAAAQLDPALQPYAYRLASRFEWNPDAYRIAVTAPNAALAQARTDVLRRVLAPAITSGRLTIAAAVGPSALTVAGP